MSMILETDLGFSVDNRPCSLSPSAQNLVAIKQRQRPPSET